MFSVDTVLIEIISEKSFKYYKFVHFNFIIFLHYKLSRIFNLTHLSKIFKLNPLLIPFDIEDDLPFFNLKIIFIHFLVRTQVS